MLSVIEELLPFVSSDSTPEVRGTHLIPKRTVCDAAITKRRGTGNSGLQHDTFMNFGSSTPRKVIIYSGVSDSSEGSGYRVTSKSGYHMSCHVVDSAVWLD